MAEFRMPSLGADMAAGRLVEWLKKPGDSVQRGDIIAEVDTDKGVIEVEVYSNGVIEKILIEPGEKVPVGTPMAIIREAAEAETGSVVEPAPPAPAAARAHPRRRKASPLARRVADELGVDLATVTGTGPGGAITRQDVEGAAAGRRPAAAPETPTSAADRMRRAIAAAMARSKREIPHYYLSHRIDVGPSIEWLEGQNRERPAKERLLWGAVLLHAVARVLRQFPEFNAWWEDGRPVLKPEINVGVAIALRGGGLLAPALHQVDQQPLDDLSRNLRDLVRRVRAGKLRSSEMTDPTITVTSLGDRGVETVFGIIYPPQVAIVGFGTVRQLPWAVDGAVGVRPVVTATLSADHRVSDGHRGALFLAAIAEHVQEPPAP